MEGNVYKTLRIGSQVWTIENYRATHYNDGNPIMIDTITTRWAYARTDKCCFYENVTDSDSVALYGALYNWFAASKENFAPEGWHVSTEEDWLELERYLIEKGYSWENNFEKNNKIAIALALIDGWVIKESLGCIGNDPELENKCGFSARSVGYRHADGSYFARGYETYWWTTTSYDTDRAYGKGLYNWTDTLARFAFVKSQGKSVRLVKN